MSSSTETKPKTEEQVAEDSAKYMASLRLASVARIRNDDGTIGEAGALPHEDLVKIYLNEQPLNKEMSEQEQEKKPDAEGENPPQTPLQSQQQQSQQPTTQ